MAEPDPELAAPATSDVVDDDDAVSEDDEHPPSTNAPVLTRIAGQSRDCRIAMFFSPGVWVVRFGY
jgi:hypothetical protein